MQEVANNLNWTWEDETFAMPPPFETETEWVYELGTVVQVTFTNPPGLSQGDRVSFFRNDAYTNNEVIKDAIPIFSGIIKEFPEKVSQPNTVYIELQTELRIPIVPDDPNNRNSDVNYIDNFRNGTTDYKVVTFTTPHTGRRGKIVMAVKQALERIRQGDPVGRRLAWLPDTGERYPMSVNAVLLEPLQPINLDRDNLLPAIIVSYGDGIRNYKARRRANNSQRDSSYNTLNEVEEDMTVMLRVILRANLEATRELAEQGVLTGESLTITIANIHESIDTALGDGLDLAFNGERIEGIRSLRVMRWQTPFDMWANDYAILDIPVIITHVFHRGTGV